MRQLYKDPVTGGDFKLILGSEGGIWGVVSASKDAPFKKVDFDKELEDFDNAKTYADWKFLTNRRGTPPPVRGTPPPGIAPGAISPPRMGNPL